MRFSGFFAAALAFALSFARAAAENQNGEFAVSFSIVSKSNIPKPFQPICEGVEAAHFIVGEIVPNNPKSGNYMIEMEFKTDRADAIKCKLGWISTGKKFAIALKSPNPPPSAEWRYEVFVLMRK